MRDRLRPRGIVARVTQRWSRRDLLIAGCMLLGMIILGCVVLPRLLGRGAGSATAPPATVPGAATGPGSTPTPEPTLVPTRDAAQAAQCRDQIKPFLAQADPLMSEWVDERRQAGRAPIETLPAEIDKLKSARQRLRALPVPLCIGDSFARLLDAMDRTIEAYQSFVADLPEDTIRQNLAQADQSFAAYVEQIDQLR